MIQQNLIQLQAFFEAHPVLVATLIIWSAAWKAVAVWKAARLSHKIWFVVLFLANTIGILEIAYIFLIAKKYSVHTETENGDEAVSKN